MLCQSKVCSFRLRVKDKEGLEGNATTLLTVIKETDYPPTANAGGDQIIYLPQVSPDVVFCAKHVVPKSTERILSKSNLFLCIYLFSYVFYETNINMVKDNDMHMFTLIISSTSIPLHISFI